MLGSVPVRALGHYRAENHSNTHRNLDIDLYTIIKLGP